MYLSFFYKVASFPGLNYQILNPFFTQMSYLPTMPEDMRLEAKRAVRERVQWYGKSTSSFIYVQYLNSEYYCSGLTCIWLCHVWSWHLRLHAADNRPSWKKTLFLVIKTCNFHMRILLFIWYIWKPFPFMWLSKPWCTRYQHSD